MHGQANRDVDIAGHADSNTDNTIRHGQLFEVQCNDLYIIFIVQFSEQSNATHSALLPYNSQGFIREDVYRLTAREQDDEYGAY
jgi:hypothetical protein